MTTPLEAEIQQEVYDTIQEVGATATFRVYPSQVTDPFASTVTLGAATEYEVKVVPPENDARLLDDAGEGAEVERNVLRIHVPTGVGAVKADGTSAALPFTPELGQEVVFRGQVWRIVPEIGIVQPGDDVLLYELRLEA